MFVNFTKCLWSQTSTFCFKEFFLIIHIDFLIIYLTFFICVQWGLLYNLVLILMIYYSRIIMIYVLMRLRMSLHWSSLSRISGLLIISLTWKFCVQLTICFFHDNTIYVSYWFLPTCKIQILAPSLFILLAIWLHCLMLPHIISKSFVVLLVLYNICISPL